MSNHHTDELTRALRERSEDMTGTHLALEDVKGRARGIRRRRRAMTGVAAAAVLLAVGAPIGLTVDGLGRSGQPVRPVDRPSATSSPTQDAAPAPEPRPDGSFPLTLDGLPVGDAPRLPYVLVDQRQLVTPERTYDLPTAFLQVVPFRGGWLGIAEITTGAGGLELRFMDEGFQVQRAVPTGPALIRNADGSRVAFTERDGDTTWLVNASTTSDDERRHEITGAGDLQPVGFLDDDTLVLQSTSGAAQNPAVQEADESWRLKPLINARGVSPTDDLVSGLVSFDGDTSCSAVVDRLGDEKWRTCDYVLDAFSPDGRYVLGYPTYYDAAGPSTLTLLDAATGDAVTTFSPGRSRQVVGVSQARWEDDGSVLVALNEGTRLGLVRAEVNGRLESVTDTVDNSDMTTRLWFAESPRF